MYTRYDYGWSNWSGGEPPRYPTWGGHALYHEASITGLNRIPVDLLMSYALTGASVSGDTPIPLEDIARHILLAGSTLLIDDIPVPNVIYADGRRLLQAVYQPGQPEHIIEYATAADGWVITRIYDYGSEVEKREEIERGAFENISYIYNPVSPTGVLYPAQYTYRRLEEIERGLRKLQSGPSVKTIVTGHIRNIEQARRELTNDGPIAFVPGADVSIDKTGDTNAVAQMLSEYGELINRYWQQVHVTEMDTVQRPSSTDRKLTLGPMMRYVETLRNEITRVLAVWGASWTYERLHTADVQERRLALDLLREMRNDGIIGAETYQVYGEKLL